MNRVAMWLLWVFAISGCGSPPAPMPAAATSATTTFALWRVDDIFGEGAVKANRSRLTQMEGGLDRVVCEMLQTKQEQQEKAKNDLIHDLNVGMIKSGLEPRHELGMTITRYRCVRTGLEPETEGPRS